MSFSTFLNSKQEVSANKSKQEVSVFSFYICPPLSLQQAFNATAVIRHMRRLQLGTSFGSSISSSSSVSEPQSRTPAKSQSVDCAPLSLQDCE